MACTGIEFCKLAIVETKGRARDLYTELDKRLPDFDTPISINVNGCPNSCARFQLADIGLKGSIVDGEEGFQVHLGGSLGADPGFGRKIRGLKVTADGLPDYVERLLRNYQADRADGEQFAAWVRRADQELLTMTAAGESDGAGRRTAGAVLLPVLRRGESPPGRRQGRRLGVPGLRPRLHAALHRGRPAAGCGEPRMPDAGVSAAAVRPSTLVNGWAARRRGRRRPGRAAPRPGAGRRGARGHRHRAGGDCAELADLPVTVLPPRATAHGDLAARLARRTPRPTIRPSTRRSPPRPSGAGSGACGPTTPPRRPAWTPAVTRHGDVTVAVTAGGDPRRSQRLRSAIAHGARRPAALPVRPAAAARPATRPAGSVALVGGGPAIRA